MSAITQYTVKSATLDHRSRTHTGTFHRLGTAIALLALSGCATLDKDECLRGDWPTVGYSDGKDGLDPEKQLQRHAKACGKHNIAPDRAQYDEGYARGLVVFCSPDSAYDHALDKNEYRGNCPVDLETAFLEGYTDGLLALIDRTDVEIDEHDDDKDDARLELAILSGNKDANPKSVKRARDRLKSAESQLSSARYDRSKYRRWLDRWLKKLRQNN